MHTFTKRKRKGKTKKKKSRYGTLALATTSRYIYVLTNSIGACVTLASHGEIKYTPSMYLINQKFRACVFSRAYEYDFQFLAPQKPKWRD
jgi:hypothetical protein